MSKKSLNVERHSCFLKVSSYYKKYIETKYGTPVRFPQNSLMGMYLQAHLFRDVDFSGITDFSYNEVAFHFQPGKSLFSVEFQVLTDSQKEDFLELEMPESVYKYSGEVKVDRFFHLNINGSKKIRTGLKREFWCDFARFHDECVFRANRIGESVTAEDVMSDFITLYGIDMKCFETLMRYWWRYKLKMKSDIQERRDELEKRTGKICTYTP